MHHFRLKIAKIFAGESYKFAFLKRGAWKIFYVNMWKKIIKDAEMHHFRLKIAKKI